MSDAQFKSMGIVPDDYNNNTTPHRWPESELQLPGELRPDFLRPIVWFTLPVNSILANNSLVIYGPLQGKPARAIYIKNNSSFTVTFATSDSTPIPATLSDIDIPPGSMLYSDEVIVHLSMLAIGGQVSINDGTNSCVKVRVGL